MLALVELSWGGSASCDSALHHAWVPAHGIVCGRRHMAACVGAGTWACWGRAGM